MITGSFIRSRNTSDGTNSTYHSSSRLTRIGRIFGVAVRQRRLASVICAAFSRSAVLSMLVSEVAYTPVLFDLDSPNSTRSLLFTNHVLRCAADAAP